MRAVVIPEKNVVEVTSLLIFWSTPMIYPWSRVADHFGGTWVETVYLCNPLASAVMVSHAKSSPPS